MVSRYLQYNEINKFNPGNSLRNLDDCLIDYANLDDKGGIHGAYAIILDGMAVFEL